MTGPRVNILPHDRPSGHARSPFDLLAPARAPGEHSAALPASGERTMAEQETGELSLTYAELAARLRVSADGARTRAKRAGWPVIVGNDGRARVRVLASDLPERPAEQNPVTTDPLGELKRAHAERVAELKGELERAREGTERWRSAAEQARAEGERDRAVIKEVRDQLDRELARVARLEEELRGLRRPWWRRWVK
jgi:hypothetical protein